jgi:PAS domain S-box-containing protein
MSFLKPIPAYQKLEKVLLACIILLSLLILTINSALALTYHEITSPPLQTDITSSLIDKDTLIVGSEQDYPPFATGMTDETAGGFTVDLWKAVAAETGLKYTIRVRPFHELLKEFKAGKIDILLNLATSKERHLFADFTVPHAVIHGGIFVRKGESSINSEADLTGKSIIVLNADLAHDYAVSKDLSKQLILVDTAAEGMRLLASGKHDAMLISKLAGMQTLQKLGISNINALKVNAGFEQKFAFAVPEGHSELLSRLNETLVLLKTNGTYDKLYEKWFGVYEVKTVTLIDVLNYLLPVLIIFLAIALYSVHRRRLEIRAAQKTLQKSEHTLSEVLENVGSYIFLKDLNGRYLYANRKVCELFGTTLEAIVGQSDEQFFDAETVEKIRKNDNQVLLEGKTLRTEETNLKTNHGVPATYLVVKLPLRNDLGEVYALCGISTEITDMKQIEAELEKNISLLNSTLESTTDAILVVDLNNTWVSKNQRFIDLWHIPDDIIAAKNDRAALSYVLDQLEYPESFLNKVRELYNTPEASSFDTFKFKNGKIIERYSIPQIVGKEVVGRVWSFRDVTESTQAETKLKQSENYARAVIESSPVPMALNDIHGNITYLNTAFIQTLGYTLNDIPTLEVWWPLAYPDAQYRHGVTERWQRNLDKAKLHNSAFTPIEVNIRCKDHSIRTFMCGTTDIQGDFSGNHLVTLYDITERKEAESEIKKMRLALVESHERYVDLYEFAPIGYLSLNKHGLITEVNWKITALFGLQRKELIHHRLAEFVTEDDSGQWRRNFSDLKNLVDGEEFSFEVKFNHSKGTEFIASLIVRANGRSRRSANVTHHYD